MTHYLLTLAISTLLTADRPPSAPLVDWPSLTVNVTGSVLDTVSTIRFLSNGSGCTEGNPRLGPHPSTGALWRDTASSVAITAGVAVGLNVVARHTQSARGARIARWTSRALNYYAGGSGALTAARNISACGW